MLGRTRACWPFALLLIGSCASPRTGLVIVVESDLSVPSPLASVRVEAGASTRDFVLAEPGSSMPFSFGVEPEGGDASRIATLTIEGRDPSGAAIVTQRVRVGFRLGRTLVLRVRLDAACAGIACDDATTCARAECVDARIDEGTLPELVPGHELDPVSSEDAGPLDDGGALPRACRELADGSARGVYRIDPDGAGASPSFDAYCETIEDGGGWTLIAKVDPATTTLGYDAPAWTALTPITLGVNDTSRGDALLPSYWQLPVSELRIVMEEAGETRAMIARLDRAEPVTLRAAMEPEGAVGVAASLEAWTALVNMTLAKPTCVVSGAPVQTPFATPVVRVRIGVTASLDASCAPVMVWVGLGADTRVQGGACRTTTITAGGARLCNPSPEDHPAFTLLFAR